MSAAPAGEGGGARRTVAQGAPPCDPLARRRPAQGARRSDLRARASGFPPLV